MRSRRRLSSGPNFLGLFVLLLLIVAGFFAAIQILPFIQASGFGKAERFNVVIAGDKTLLFSFDVPQKSGVVLNFPDDLYMPEVAFGYGQYRISSVYGVGELDHRGGATISQTLQEYVGVPIDGFVLINGSHNGLKQTILSKDFLTGNTDLTIPEKLQLISAVAGLRDDKIKSVDISKLASPLVLADGSEAIFLEKEELDNFLSGIFNEGNLQDEGLRVEVVNTTKVAGLGSRVSRLLSNIGMSVVNVDTTSEQLDKCRIDTDEKDSSSKTVARIAGIYNCQISKTNQDARASVRVLVGSNYANQVSP